ncbi:MAG: 50S ribosomal protein L6, partial [Anaerolineae bacterium]
GFRKELDIEGVGYRGEMQGDKLVLYLGFSHPVEIQPPEGVAVSVERGAKGIVVEGADKEAVGQTAAEIRATRPPEPYKGKGIRYRGEQVRSKPGKAGKIGLEA